MTVSADPCCSYTALPTRSSGTSTAPPMPERSGKAGQQCEGVLVEGAGHGIWPSLFTPTLADIIREFLPGRSSMPL